MNRSPDFNWDSLRIVAAIIGIAAAAHAIRSRDLKAAHTVAMVLSLAAIIGPELG